MTFEPIAIVGRSCILPGALDPAAFWANVRAGRDLLGRAPPGRWRVPREAVLGSGPDRAWTDVGGYVAEHERSFTFEGLALPAASFDGLDPVFRWTVHGVREALRSAGREGTPATGLVLGNLSFPSAGMARFAESVWLRGLGDVGPVDARNRFTSGLPALLAARALGLGAGAFALDAACASSLYAMKLACDRLHDRTADTMVAGAVNAADDLFIHVGFTALSALSRTGRSRPFHRDADGLVPAEGAAFVVLRRLSDALAAREPVLGVIRGIGLSNDGRGRGLLAPSEEGQVRAMHAAWEAAGLAPRDVGLVECHATGTQVGDATELRSMARVFEGTRDLPVGSLKSNLGHLVTAAGVAGLLKVLAAMEAGERPPSLHADEPIDELRQSHLRVVSALEPWTGPRRAAVSAFGFGGNNAHLVVEALGESPLPVVVRRREVPKIGIVAIGARVGNGSNSAEFLHALRSGRADPRPRVQVEVVADGLRFPPRDLSRTHPQQLLVLEATREATAGLALPATRTAVYVGTGCDPAVARYGARWRVGEPEAWKSRGAAPDAAWRAAARDAFAEPLEAAAVVGTMPNMPANRVNSQLDLGAAGFTVSAEEHSGLVALGLAVRALAAGEIDAAIVGASDLSHDPVHAEALEKLGISRAPGDAAVALVLERVDDARRRGHPVLATVEHVGATNGLVSKAISVAPQFGQAHAATALVDVAAAALCLAHRFRPPSWVGPENWSTDQFLDVGADALEGAPMQVRLGLADAVPVAGERPVAGRVLTFDAHRPEIQLDSRESVQSMPPAPALPSMLADLLERPAWVRSEGGEGTGGFEPAAEKRTTVHFSRSLPHAVPTDAPPDAVRAPDPMPRFPTAPPPMPATALAGPAAMNGFPAASQMRTAVHVSGPAEAASRIAAAHAQIVAVHRETVAQQAAVHEQFLAMRADAVARLGRMGRSLATGPFATAAIDADVRRPDAPPAAVSEPPRTPTRPPPRSPAESTTPAAAGTLPGPKFSRADLEELASGRISRLFGPLFAAQDGFRRQVRMPRPPLLLADRVTGIRGEPASMTTGTIWTETDVRPDAWYLGPEGRMPAGLVIEAGQADLLLISWLGADLANRGERVYRLLGCTLTFHGPLPERESTLTFDIHVDGHARQGETRLFFFHYDCHVGDRLLLSVRGGQAGFFSDSELADSAGILWSPERESPFTFGRLDAGPVPTTRTRLDAAALEAFARGDAAACFGEGFEAARVHVRTPRIAGDRLLLLDEVVALDRAGGPWERGYLRAEQHVAPGDWFFDGHFQDDPCMPGTLMFEGCLQAMSVYLASQGFTLAHDGWRFEPVQGEEFVLRCRGQVTPASRLLVYEVFVRELHAGPQPTLYADLLCTVDGLKAFHARRVGLRLVPDWPLDRFESAGNSGESATTAIAPARRPTRPAATVNGITFDERALLASARGRPSDAFGPSYARFDAGRRVARLPGPPYLFVSRIASIDAEPGALRAGGTIEAEFDIPADAWFFRENGAPVAPLAVVMEAALQPCGWFASFAGCALTSDDDLLFRNLDGTATLHRELSPGASQMRTTVHFSGLSRTAGMILVTFDVTSFVDGERLFDMKTVFGFFPPNAFDDQPGLPVTGRDRARIASVSSCFRELSDRGGHLFTGTARLAGPMLLMLDRITAFEPDGGRAGRGWVRGEKDVDAGAWFFRAHFFQDPVQPGSLGIEALTQLLQFFLLETAGADALRGARFEPLMTGRPLTWKYRGQVLPTNRRIVTELDIVETGRDERGVFAVAEGSLWVDGRRIYEVKNLGMRLVRDVENASFPAESVREPWRRLLGSGAWAGEDLSLALVDRLVGRVHVADAEALRRASANGLVFVANHQVAVESILFTLVAATLVDRPVSTLAKAEHRHTWLGRLVATAFSRPGLVDPGLMRYFDRANPASLPGIVRDLADDLRAGRRHVLVHAEGTRALAAGRPVQAVSGTILDLALLSGASVVPVRFSGALPVEPVLERLDFPLDFARQDVHVGTPIAAATLAALPLKERVAHVLAALNALGPPLAEERPNPPDEAFAADVAGKGTGAILRRLLASVPHPSDETRAILAGTPRDAWERRFADLLET